MRLDSCSILNPYIRSEHLKEFAEELFEIYQNLALTGDDRRTAQDFNLRDLEVDYALQFVPEAKSLLDIGCGLGYTTRIYATNMTGELFGIDYSPNMISRALEINEGVEYPSRLSFLCKSVLDTGFSDNQFDLIVSHRCIMALLDWDLQKEALEEMARILKPGGQLIMFEGTFQGLTKLNKMRSSFGLNEIDGSGRGGLYTLKLDEEKFEKYISNNFSILKHEGFGTYYFLTRIFYPLYIYPDSPSFENSFAPIAKDISKVHPNLVDIGHLSAYVLQRNS